MWLCMIKWHLIFGLNYQSLLSWVRFSTLNTSKASYIWTSLAQLPNILPPEPLSMGNKSLALHPYTLRARISSFQLEQKSKKAVSLFIWTGYVSPYTQSSGKLWDLNVVILIQILFLNEIPFVLLEKLADLSFTFMSVTKGTLPSMGSHINWNDKGSVSVLSNNQRNA